MSILSHLLRSLALTTFLSFATPILLVSGLLVALSLVGYVPGIALMGQIGASQILQFLAVFGSGYPVQGMLIIGFTCGIVGSLFDLFNFYLYQSLRNH